MALNGFGDDVKGVVLDISGVLKDCGPGGGVAIQGSVEAIEKLNNSGMKIRFCTNETSISRFELVESLKTLGFKIEEKDVFSPIPAMCIILKERDLRPHLLVHPDSLSDFDSIDKNEPNCVVIGDAVHLFSYDNLNNAFKILMEMKNPTLFSLGQGKYYKDNNKLTLDVGPFKAALEYATGITAEVVGKPSQSFFNTVLHDMSLSPSEVVMVGDDIVNDVGGAQKCGMKGVQVRTGKFQPSDEIHPTVKPDAYVDNLLQFVDLLLSKKY